MQIDYFKAKATGTENFVVNVSSLTLLLSMVVFLGVVCRFLKRCLERLRRKRAPELKIKPFSPIRRRLTLCKANSTGTLERRRRNIHQGDRIPFSTEQVLVQPEQRDTLEALPRPRVPSDPQRRYAGVGMIRQSSLDSKLKEHRGSIVRSTSHIDIVPSLIDPKIYRREISLERFQTRCDKKCGMLDTELYFNEKEMKIEVKIMGVEQQLFKSHVVATNAYVTVRKLPEGDVQRTSLHTGTIDPVFNSNFTFKVNPSDHVSSYVLIFELYHMDRFSTSYPHGEARLPLFQVDLTIRKRLMIPFVDVRRSFLSTFHPSYRSTVTGCLLVSLKYQPWKDTIVVNPIRVCNIPKKIHGTYDKDVYIKIVLRHRGTKQMKLKTETKEMEKMSRNSPYYQATFDEPLQLDVKSIPVEESDITISLNHYLFLKSSFIIGQVRISTTEKGYEATHLQSVIDFPGNQISVWYEICGFTSSTGME